jgi:hypothetical protein
MHTAKTIQDKAFDSEEHARIHATKISAENVVYIILTADQYFVSGSKNIQPYEKLVATYTHGKACGR